MVFSSHAKSFNMLYSPTNKGYIVSYTKHRSLVQQLRVGLTSALVIPIVITVFFNFFTTAQPALATVVACPLSDSSDGTTDGTITIGASTTWTMPSGAAGDYWDCTGVNILVTNNAVLTLVGNTASGAYPYIQTDNLQIDSGASISGNGKGCARVSSTSYGPNASNICSATTAGAGGGSPNGSGEKGAGGGGYGGNGGGSTFGGGTHYGSESAPALFGSSGGNYWNNYGGTGGGVIRITVSGTVTNNGSINAKGNAGMAGGSSATGSASGGGSGGAIYVVTGAIAGSGSYAVNGGNGGDGSSADGGGGGGGRISLNYSSSTATLTSSTLIVAGGTGPGSAADGSAGSAYVNNQTTGTLNIFGTYYYETTQLSATTVVFDTAARQLCETNVVTPGVSATNITFAGTFSCSASGLTSFTLAASTNLEVSSGASITLGTSNANLELALGSGDAVSLQNFTLSLADRGYFITDDAVDLALSGTTTITANVSWTNLASLDIDAGIPLNADGKGCSDTAGNGSGPNASNVCTDATGGYGRGSGSGGTASGGGGAGHGGNGGASTFSAGGTYGSETAPTLFGSSGGSFWNNYGGNGGGVIRIGVSGQFTFDGSFSVNGSAGMTGGSSATTSASGGGSGGSIYVTTGTFAGSTGSFSVAGGNGGDGGAADGGGGGGGRVAVYYVTDSSSFLSGLAASGVAPGGIGPGAAADGSVGTLYLFDTTTPIATTPTSITQGTDGTGKVTFTTTLTDGDSESRLKVEYSDDGGSTWKDPILSNATVNSGAIDYDNSNAYQIGTVNGVDTDDFSSVIVTVQWDTQNAQNNGGAGGPTGYQTDIQVRVTPYDGTNLGAVQTSSSFNLDNATPASLASLTTGSTGIRFIPLTWTAATDNNFDHYEIWYGAVQSDVQNRTGAAVEWDNSDDATLATATTAATTITGISLTGTVYFKIWAIDTYGNASTITDVNATFFPLSNWLTYQEVVVDNSAGTALTNFQVLINVTSTTNIDSSCNDIRIINFDQQTQIDFWVERCDTVGGDVRIWAELPTISAATTDNIFVYYNNPSLDVSASNSTNTFLDFIDENDVASFSTPWNSAAYGAFNVFESTGGYIHAQRTSGSYKDAAVTLNSAVDAVTDVVVESRFKHNSPNTNTDGRFLVLDSSNTAYGKVFVHWLFPLANNQDSFGYYNGVYNALGDTTFSFDTNFISVFNIKRSTSKVDYYVYSDGRASLASAVNSAWGAGAPTAINKFAIIAHTTSKLADIYLDYVLFRKYAATPPVVSILGNTAPTATSISCTQIADGSKDVTVSAVIDDAENSNMVQYKLEASTDGGATWGITDPTVSTTDGETTATFGDPKVDNTATFQVGSVSGYIATSSGANTVSTVWEAGTDVTPAVDISNLQVRVTPFDGVDAGTPVASANCLLDMVVPTTPGSFAVGSPTISTAPFTWTASTETNFNHYELWYGTNTTDVANRTGTAIEWDNDSNDAALATISTATTTVTGLTSGTTYYAKLCAVDNLGNESCTSSNISFTTISAPTASSVSCSQRTDGSNGVTVSAILNDADLDPLKMKVEGSLDGGSTWGVSDTTISTTNADTSATFGDPGVDNTAEYHVGIAGANILTASGANTVSTVWNAGTDVASTTDISNARVRVTPNDGTNIGSAASSGNCVLDLVSPTTPGSFATSASSNAFTPTWTASTETNFNHYEIWYGTTAADVTNRTGTATEWDNDNDAALATRTTTTTTITGLSSATTYYLIICAVDNYGHESCSASNLTAATGTPPTVSGVSAAQKTDGSNVVDLQFVIDDADNNDQVMARVEVNTGSGWTNATLAPLDALTTAEWGDPKINNTQTFNGSTYQVGTSAGYILTSSGENRVHVDLTAANFTGINSATVQVRVTANDQGSDGTTATSSNFIIDTTNPTVPGSLTKVTTERGDWATLTWTASTETNFDHYEIWHGVSQTAVENKTANEFDDIPDEPLLATLSTATATLTTLTAGLSYYAMICAVDDYGHDACSSAISFTANTPPSVSNITLTPAQDGTGVMAVDFTISDNENATGINAVLEYNLQDGNGWKKATLSSTVTNTAGTTPTINNSAAYPIGGITGPVAGNNLGVQWDSRTDVGNTTVSSVLMRVRTADSIDSATAQATSGVTVDTAAPTGLGSFQETSYTSTQMAMGWNTVTETNFSRYEVWYGTNESDVNNRTGTATRWDNGNDSSLASTATANTTITGLAANTTYYFKLFAKDQYLNEASVDAFSYKTNALPTVSSLGETHRRAGDGYITVDVVVSESDTSDTLSGALQYNIGQGWRNATIYLVSGSGVTLDNTAARQLGNIAVTTGSKTIQVLWDSKTDLPTTEINTAQVRFVPYDQIESGTVTSITNVLVDNVVPSGLTNLRQTDGTANSVSVAWTPVATEPNFDHYEIWYGTSQSDVTNRSGSAQTWDVTQDSNLSNENTSTSTITGLSGGSSSGAHITATTNYYFTAVAVDQAGNEGTTTTITATPDPNFDREDDELNDDENSTEQPPVFSGSLPNVTFEAGTTTAAVFDLSEYFSQEDDLLLTYSVTGQHSITVDITNGEVNFSAPEDFSGSEELTFFAIDTNNRSAQSNTIVVSVTEQEEEERDDEEEEQDEEDSENEIPTEAISHVIGTNRNVGVIQVIGVNGTVLSSWQAFSSGGVVPRLAIIQGEYYVLAVKKKPGTTMRIYTSTGVLVRKKRISPNVHWRTITNGDLDKSNTNEEIVFATLRGRTVYFKTYTFSPKNNKIRLSHRVFFRAKHGTNLKEIIRKQKYAVSVANARVRLHTSKNHRLFFTWKPFK